GIDIKWRQKVVKMVHATQPQSILDIATGTGDLAINLAKETHAPKIVGLDISAGMLAVGKQKVADKNLTDRIELVMGDSELLAFGDQSSDAITVACGVRNAEELAKGLAEKYRVLNSVEAYVVLATSMPTTTSVKHASGLATARSFPVIGELF